MLVGLEPGSSGGDLIERKAAVDDRPEPAIAQRRQEVCGKSLGRFGALRRRAQAVADAVEMQATLGEPIDIELALGNAAHPTDRHKPAADRERVEAGREDVGADIIDDHVDAIIPNHPRDSRAKPLAAGDDAGVQPMGFEPFELIRRA
jgi:hypothetical protein